MADRVRSRAATLEAPVGARTAELDHCVCDHALHVRFDRRTQRWQLNCMTYTNKGTCVFCQRGQHT